MTWERNEEHECVRQIHFTCSELEKNKPHKLLRSSETTFTLTITLLYKHIKKIS
jgi:hypothetical protein